MKKRFLLIIFTFVLMPISVLGLTLTPKLSCNKESMKEGEEVTCDVSVSVDESVTSITANIEVTSNLELSTPASLGATNEEGLSGNISLGTIKATAISSGSAKITLNNIKANEEDFSPESYNITIIEESVSLDSLSIDGEEFTPAFSKDVLEYSLTTKKESITITATSSDGTVTGTGTKQLKVGNNKFEITVAKDKLTKTYTINVTREEEKKLDTTLKKISLSSGTIKFKPDTLEYNITLDSTTASIKITAEPADTDAKVKFTPNSTISLDQGETKTVTITVTQTNEEYTEYKLNITREKDESSKSNLNLKSLSIKGVSFDFKPSVLSYDLNVENNITHADIEYEVEDKDSEVSIVGNTTLKVGTNKIKVVVTGKSGKTKTYTLNITRNKSRVVLSNNEEEIINKINDDNDNEDIYVSVLKDEDKLITKNILETLNKSKKALVYEVMDDDEVSYSVKFKGGKLKVEDSFNYEIAFVSDNEDGLTKLLNTNTYLPIVFKSSDKLPGDLTYKIYVKDKSIKNQKKLNLYKFNAGLNELELIKKDITVKDGFIEVDITDNNEYVLAYLNTPKKGINENILIPSILLPLLLITVVICLLVRKKKAKTNK